MIVTYRHYRTIPSREGTGYCRGKGQAWFERHGLDFRDFVRNGIAEETLLATGDGMAQQLVAWARECEARGAAHGR